MNSVVVFASGVRGWGARVVLLLAALWLGGCVLAASPEPASGRGCDRFASPRGSNHFRGSRQRPFRTVQRLVDRLRPGQVGCLRRGTYRGDVKIRRPGTRKRRIVLRSYPGEGARILGSLWVARSFVTVRGLYLDARNPHGTPSPTVTGNDVRFVKNDVTNEHTAICFLLGVRGYGIADRTQILRNRIHDCGRTPRTNLDHGIYVSQGRAVRIEGNWIYDNADYGVHLYPNAQGTQVSRNIIFGNGGGVIFAGEHGHASSANLVGSNVIGGSTSRFDVESYWPEGNPIGTGNVLRRNCVGPRSGEHGGILPSQEGFTALDNLLAIPRFADVRRRNFRIARRDRCRALLGSADVKPGPRARPPALSR
jgi:parallel beta-helix repeat protein